MGTTTFSGPIKAGSGSNVGSVVMAQSKEGKRVKKTKQGKSINTKKSHKGGGVNGSTKGKHYKKKYRGQGR